MRILLVNNFYYNRGGDCTYLLSLKGLLEKKGHDVIVFSMHHPLNFKSEYSPFFVSHIDYAEVVKKKNILSYPKVLTRTVYSREAQKKINQLLQEYRPDVAHLQNIHHHITPSILYSLRKSNIPVVWTMHDFSSLCPNTALLCRDNICEKCKKTKYYWAVIRRCKKDSLAASAMAAAESAIHRLARIMNLVDIFIMPSEFIKNKYIEYGFPGEKIKHLKNFIDVNSTSPEKYQSTDAYYLYAGRISKEKGVKTLVDATINMNEGRLKIVGDGPLKIELIDYAKSTDKNHRIEFLGHKSYSEVMDITKHSQFVILPSINYENCPYSILEAFACQKPVIGSRIGGIPELVKNGETGMTFEPGNVKELSECMKKMLNDSNETKEMGKRAQAFVKYELNSDKHYHGLLNIYEDVINQRMKIHRTIA